MSVLPARLAMAATAAVSRASSLATSAMPFALQGCELGFVDVGGEYGGSLARKGHGASAADADGGGGDEGALALQAV